MVIAHAQTESDYLSVTSESSLVFNVYGKARKVKPLRMVRKPVTPARIEITPVFVGIAG